MVSRAISPDIQRWPVCYFVNEDSDGLCSPCFREPVLGLDGYRFCAEHFVLWWSELVDTWRNLGMLDV